MALQVCQVGPSTWSLNLVPQLGPSTWSLNLVPQLFPQLGPQTGRVEGEDEVAGRVEAEDEVEAQLTRLGMLRLKLRPIDGATRKLEFALEFSCT